MKIVLLALMAICNSVCFGQNLNKAPKPTKLVDAIAAIKPALVKIEVELDPDSLGRPTGGSSGTGFFVSSKGYIITNNHVISQLFTSKKAKLTVLFPMPSIRKPFRLSASFVGYTAKVVVRDIENDLALIKLDQNPFDIKDFGTLKVNEKHYGKPVIPQFATRILRDGEQIAVSGFPLGSEIVTTNVGYISSSDLPGDDYEADLRMNHGNSGGPVYSAETGQVIGVAVAIQMAEVEFFAVELKGPIRPSELSVRVHVLNAAKRDTIVDYPANKIIAQYNSGLSRVISFSKVVALMKTQKIEPK